MENYAYKTIYEEGGWSIVDTLRHRGLYKYSLYCKGEWSQTSPSIDILKETIKNAMEYDKIIDYTKKGNLVGLIALKNKGGLSWSNVIEVDISIDFLMKTP